MNHPISKISTPNSTIQVLPVLNQHHNQVIHFLILEWSINEWRNDDNTYVQAYRWKQNGFIEDSTYYFGIDKRYYFPMIYDKTDVLTRSQIIYKDIKKYHEGS